MIIGRGRRGVGGLIVIDKIVHINRVAARERLAVVRVGPEVAIPAERPNFGVRVELLPSRVGDDAILKRDVLRADRVNVVPLSKANGNVIKNDGIRQVAADAVARAVTVQHPLPAANVADDDIRRTANASFARNHAKAIARRSLAGDGGVVLNLNSGVDRAVS